MYLCIEGTQLKNVTFNSEYQRKVKLPQKYVSCNTGNVMVRDRQRFAVRYMKTKLVQICMKDKMC